MKKLLITFTFLIIALGNANAQHNFSLTEFKEKLGKIDTLCDKVFSVNIVSDTLTILAMGGKPPHQKYNIAAKGDKVNMDFTNIKGKRVCIIGPFVNYKGRPQVTATRADQFVVDTLPKRDK
ncbi:hypothetical protein DJ568_14235 [Mucilaginibacter hurinus]|uniref:Uncharacterized protein n=1 Tax=Mucilaginibacter hurinus TaxID=2201324 RepID=A0A367GKP3_9SPHI|nr:hypothetical protein [Mucilaginibacter hurinus]RCH54042.1 hypothetical protein DJ568_14235 [Mucilaginibacter hurinus]